jgi:cell division ATPase MinD
MVRIINICSGKGGVGKTVVATNLGIALQEMYKKVAIIDFNFTTPHLSLYFGLFSYPITLNNFLRNEVELEKTIYNHPSGLSVIPASLDLIDIVNTDTSNLRDEIRRVFWNYDFVLLDSAPGLGKEALVSLKASDEVLFVANPQIPSLVDIVKCLKVINTLEPRPVPLGIIVNRLKRKSYEITLQEIRDFTELPIIGAVPEDGRVLETENKKTLVITNKRNSAASKAFFKIASRLSGTTYQYSFWDKIRKVLGRKNEFW